MKSYLTQADEAHLDLYGCCPEAFYSWLNFLIVNAGSLGPQGENRLYAIIGAADPTANDPRTLDCLEKIMNLSTAMHGRR